MGEVLIGRGNAVERMLLRNWFWLISNITTWAVCGENAEWAECWENVDIIWLCIIHHNKLWVGSLWVECWVGTMLRGCWHDLIVHKSQEHNSILTDNLTYLTTGLYLLWWHGGTYLDKPESTKLYFSVQESDTACLLTVKLVRVTVWLQLHFFLGLGFPYTENHWIGKDGICLQTLFL